MTIHYKNCNIIKDWQRKLLYNAIRLAISNDFSKIKYCEEYIKIIYIKDNLRDYSSWNDFSNYEKFLLNKVIINYIKVLSYLDKGICYDVSNINKNTICLLFITFDCLNNSNEITSLKSLKYSTLSLDIDNENINTINLKSSLLKIIDKYFINLSMEEKRILITEISDADDTNDFNLFHIINYYLKIFINNIGFTWDTIFMQNINNNTLDFSLSDDLLIYSRCIVILLSHMEYETIFINSLELND